MDTSGGATRRWTRVLGQLSKDVRVFARALGDREQHTTALFVVGSPEFEPWHFAAHLREQATRHGRRDLAPTLLRWSVPPGAPAHLAVSVDALRTSSGGQTILVIDPFGESPDLLERVASAKHQGARIMTIHRGQIELLGLSHETLSVDRERPDRDFDIAQHLVSDFSPLRGRTYP